MTRKLFSPALFFFCFICLLVFTSPLDGRWTGAITTPDGTYLDVAYNFITNDEKLTGTADSPVGQVSIDNGKISGNNFSFEVTVNGTVYPHKGVLYKDSCGVDIDFGSGAFIHTTIYRDTSSVKQFNFLINR
ncbi:MAG: hypothetical protein IT214_05310 [Chitinophagaceae bacterium]|jgi:hypothetical protein|nr:hypothetical protein [Chitinophagaceae bacterium]